MRHDQADRDIRRTRSRVGRSKNARSHNDDGSNDDVLYLAAPDLWLPLIGARDMPLLSNLAGEDLCWQAGMSDWRNRRPQPWQRTERRAWRAEGKVLREKRNRITEAAAALGLH